MVSTYISENLPKDFDTSSKNQFPFSEILKFSLLSEVRRIKKKTEISPPFSFLIITSPKHGNYKNKKYTNVIYDNIYFQLFIHHIYILINMQAEEE